MIIPKSELEGITFHARLLYTVLLQNSIHKEGRFTKEFLWNFDVRKIIADSTGGMKENLTRLAYQELPWFFKTHVMFDNGSPVKGISDLREIFFAKD